MYEISRLTKTQMRRRSQIINAAMVVLARDKDLNLDNIIKISGGSKGAIYDFFGNKAGLEVAVSEEIYVRVQKLIDTITKDFNQSVASDELDYERFGLFVFQMLKALNNKKAREAVQLMFYKFPQNKSNLKHFYKEGPEQLVNNFSNFLERLAKQKGTVLACPRHCAVIILGSIIAPYFLEMVFQEQPHGLKKVELEEHSQWVVNVLLKGQLQSLV